MASFRFAIHQFAGPMEGFTGSVVAGQVLNADPKLSVGDWLEIQAPTASPFSWKYTAADLKNLLHRISEHEKQDNMQQSGLAMAA